MERLEGGVGRPGILAGVRTDEAACGGDKERELPRLQGREAFEAATRAADNSTFYRGNIECEKEQIHKYHNARAGTDETIRCFHIRTTTSEANSSFVSANIGSTHTQHPERDVVTSANQGLLDENVCAPEHTPENVCSLEQGFNRKDVYRVEPDNHIEPELTESRKPIIPVVHLQPEGIEFKQDPQCWNNFEDGTDSGTEDEQAAFMKQLEIFFHERNLDFKPPRFYGEGLNCLKLWRAVIRLGGYDQVTSSKLWRQVGESFKPPKTCTTVSWSFRCFYEKALLEYERYKVRGGELHVASSPLSEPLGLEIQVTGSQISGSGRARRDAAARAMQGWHSQRLLGNGEVGDPIIKDKSSASLPKRDKQLKNLGLLKRKKSSIDRAMKVARSKAIHPRETQMACAAGLDTIITDVGLPADWVKINVRRTRDCFEVYALVPGLLREEVRVQSDASGRLVISGEPDQPDNPWGVTPFKKVISLPSRIDAHQTSAVVTLHGQLFVRAPFEQPEF